MITRLRMQNFKSWRDTGELEIAPLTGLFGTNSSGKTSILQMLLMLKQTVESPDRKQVLNLGDERSLVSLGTFEDIIFMHQKDASLELSVSWRRSQGGEEILLLAPDDLGELFRLSFMTSIRHLAGRPVVERFNYKVGDTRAIEMSRNAPEEYDLLLGGFFEDQASHRAKSTLPDPIKCYSFPETITVRQVFDALGLDFETEQNNPKLRNLFYGVSALIPAVVSAFEDLFSSISYLGSLRDTSHRLYIWGGDRPTDVGREGGNAIAALLAARSSDKPYHQSLEQTILEHMQHMHLIHSFRLNPIAENRKEYEFMVKVNEGSPEVRIADVGTGISQILPVLVLCYYVPEGSIILLEQPEIHLHPSVQAGLADVLIDVVNNRNVQIIVESHSEHLLTRLQRRIAEEKISPDKTALYFCDIEDGVSRAERLKLDEYGNISNWPKNFFGDELGDRVAMTEAAMRRMGAG